MASKRTCERCGGKSSPHIPRKRAADGRMLCQGCMDVSARELKTTAAAGAPSGGGAWKDKKPKAQKPDFWEGELGQEGVHPLQAALPNSVWEKYNKHRELMGKDLLSPEHYAEAETPQGDSDPVHQEQPPERSRKRPWRKKKSSLQSMAIDTGAHAMPKGEGLIEHLKEHHDVPPAIAHIKGHSTMEHIKLHHAGATNHSHDPSDGSVVPATSSQHQGEMPEPGSHEEMGQHLQQHHNMQDWELEGADPEELKYHHEHAHESTVNSGGDKLNHDHPEVGPEGQEELSGEVHPHSHEMSGKDFTQHLKDHHGLSNSDIVHIGHENQSGHKDTSPMGGVHNWHENVHAQTSMDHAHEAASSESEELKHPSKYTVSSLHSHLLTDHGVHPDHMENAINGALEGVHPSHVTTMLHDQMHKAGKTDFPHTHQHYKGGPDLHPGHTDVDKPFWGSPPDNDPQKNLSHLTTPKNKGGHGLFPSQVAEMAGHAMDADDDEANAAYSNLHGNLHKTGHGDHQHVPTANKVKTPAQIKKEQLQQHLKDFHGVEHSTNPQMDHGIAHDPEGFGYKGSPNHEHPAWDQHGPVTQSLGQPYQGSPTSVPYKPGTHQHASTMSKDELAEHLTAHHHKHDPDDLGGANSFLNHLISGAGNGKKSHEELLQEHALKHTTGETNGHAHDPVAMHAPLDGPDEHYGHEPEVQTKTHPAIDNDSDALAHIIQHHPNVGTDDYSDWSKGAGAKPTMVGYHTALHTKGSKTALGNKLPKVIDGHDHAESSGPPTSISVGSHLVHEHGMDQADVAKMSPAEFKAHHEVLHAKTTEADIGHGHDYPGGPQRDPRMHLPNTHHELMRDDSKHPAAEEWYHGTGADYEGAPKNATELQEGHGFWGNYGGGDWNNHLGTHWTSLHNMAKNFGGDSSRVVHARLHIRNPITYNSLNHMSHDAYDRLRASGHMQDDGAYDNNHDDDSGYNHCCSDRLLEYAKGHHRDDGKYGVEAYRDSLRASGHDGVKVRNQADSPHGHWNAVPLSADQIEITNGGCRGDHGDERDNDTREYDQNKSKTIGDWQHPKPFKNKDYHGQLGHLPEDHEVRAANEAKKQAPLPFKTAEGRGDADPLRNGRNLGGSGDDYGDVVSQSHYCEHCEEQTDHESDDCTTSKWCDVCGESGDHTTAEEHEHCDHCGGYADHSTEDHQDEYGESPDEMRKEGYCPHCNQSTKENYNSETCQAEVTKIIGGEKKQAPCGKKLPDWGKAMAFGKPVKDDEYSADGEHTPHGELETTHYMAAADAHKHPSPNDPAHVAAHLYHHHGSDVSGKEFENSEGQWSKDALNYHHQYLHQNPQEAESRGFTPVTHSHKEQFGDFKAHGAMSPEETHAHLLLGHAGSAGGGTHMGVKAIAKLTPEEAVAKHKQMHEADDAVPWGAKDDDGDPKPKINHSHNAEATSPFPGMGPDQKFAPKGDDLIEHMGSQKHFGPGIKSSSVGELLKKSPATAEALHQQAHENYGPSAEPHASKFHVHDEAGAKDEADQTAIKKHLVDDHGASLSHFNVQTAKSTHDLMALHHKEHSGSFPLFNDPDHTHFGGTHHMEPSQHTAETMKKHQEPEAETPSSSSSKKEKIHVELPLSPEGKWGKNSLITHVENHHGDHDGLQNLAEESASYGDGHPTGNAAYSKMNDVHEELHGPNGPGHPDHYHYEHENKNKPEGKTASRRTLSDLFEEVAA